MTTRDFLETHLNRLRPSDQYFPHVMLAVGFPSPLQKQWIATLADRARPRAVIAIPHAERIFALFETAASSNLKRPTIMLTTLELRLVTDRIEISVVANYFGGIGRDNRYNPSTILAPHVGAIVAAFAAEPSVIARDHGLRYRSSG